MSLRNAWPPRPSAKNENRQLSCNISPGIVSPEGEEGLARRAVEYSRRRKRNGADDETHLHGSPGTTRDGTSPRWPVRAAEPHHQRVGSEAARRVEREAVGHIGESERAKLHCPQSADHVDADREVGQAGHDLVRDTPAKTADRVTPQPLENRRPSPGRPGAGRPNGGGVCLSCHASRPEGWESRRPVAFQPFHCRHRNIYEIVHHDALVVAG